MKIGIIGLGTVGRAIARTYAEYADNIRIHDIDRTKCVNTLEEVLECDITFICLPTPQLEGGGLDLSIIKDVLAKCEGSSANLVLKSTVPIGTTRDLCYKYSLDNLVHSPEFLTSRCAVVDSLTPTRNIIGGHFCPCARALARLYDDRFPGVPILLCNSDESEAIKLFINGFFATKIAYFNEINALCSALDISWHVVLNGMMSDGRITHSHTQVPGPDGTYGFGGACLPKDLTQLVKHLDEEMPYIDITVPKAVMLRNSTYRHRV